MNSGSPNVLRGFKLHFMQLVNRAARQAHRCGPHTWKYNSRETVLWSGWRKGGLRGPGSLTGATRAGGTATSLELPGKPTRRWGSMAMLATSLRFCRSNPILSGPAFTHPFCLCHRSHLICSSSPRPRSQSLLIMQKNKAPFLITSCSLRAAGADLKRRTQVVQNSKGKQNQRDVYLLFKKTPLLNCRDPYLDFCVAVRGEVVLQSSGLGHFPVLASEAAVRGLEIFLEGFMKVQ